MSEVSDRDYIPKGYGGSWLDRDGSMIMMERIRAENEREEERKEYLKTHPLPIITPEQRERDDEIRQKRYEYKKLQDATLQQLMIMKFPNRHDFIIYLNTSKGLVNHWYEAHWYNENGNNQFARKDEDLHKLVSSLIEWETLVYRKDILGEHNGKQKIRTD